MSVTFYSIWKLNLKSVEYSQISSHIAQAYQYFLMIYTKAKIETKRQEA